MYFSSAKNSIVLNRWFIAARGLVSIFAGFFLFVTASTVEEVSLGLFGIWLVISGFVIVLPVLFDRATARLIPMAIVRGAVSIGAGILMIILDKRLGPELVILFGLLLIVRGLLGLWFFVETEQSLRYRATTLVLSLFFIVLGISSLVFLLFGAMTFIVVACLWLILDGLHDVSNALLISQTEKGLESYRRTVLSAIGETNSVLDSEPKPSVPFHAPRSRKWLYWDTSKYKRPLVITPHPDDLEGFVGGLAFALEAPITSVIMCGGNRGVWAKQGVGMTTQDYISIRLEESAEAARLLGVQDILYMGYLDRELVCDAEAIRKTLSIMEAYQPDLIVSFEYYKHITPYAHPDHIATAEIVRRAVVSYAKRDSVDYFLTSTFLPNRFLDVTYTRRIKVDALACHTTQAGLNRIIFPFYEQSLTRLWGVMTGTGFAEGYRQVNIARIAGKLDTAKV